MVWVVGEHRCVGKGAMGMGLVVRRGGYIHKT